MTLEQGQRLSAFLREHRLARALELGFAHGVSTCHLAAAVSKLEGGHVVSIDREEARTLEPDAASSVRACGLSDFVRLYYEPRSYTWRLMRFLEMTPPPQFDFCYVDGAHSWDADGFAFFLVDRLLKPGGWIVFDDLDWTFATSPTMHDHPSVQAMPEDERTTPHIRKVYDLLVRTDPRYSDFRVENGWAWAHKVGNFGGSTETRRETVIIRRTIVEAAWQRLKRVAARRTRSR